MSVRQSLFTVFVWLARLSEKASRAWLFLGVGVLRRSDLKDVSRRSWSAFTAGDVEIFSGWSSWEEAIFRPLIHAGDRVCVVGCGTGRILLPLVAAGHDVVGIEPSPKPLATLRRILRERGQTATLIDAHVEDAALPGVFDVVLFSLNCYSYILGTDARIAVLRTLAAHLKENGRILLTYPSRREDWVNRSAALAKGMAAITRSDWRPEPFDSVLRIDVPGEAGAVICEHFFLPEEIEREAAPAGLRVLVHGDAWSAPYALLGR